MYKKSIFFALAGLSIGVLASLGLTGTTLVLINVLLVLMIETRRGYARVQS